MDQNNFNKNINKEIGLKKFTWDYAENGITEEIFLQSPELMSRILKYGNISEWSWLVNRIKKKGVRQFLKKYSYKLDNRTFNWWRIYCGLNDSFPKAKRLVGHSETIYPVK